MMENKRICTVGSNPGTDPSFNINCFQADVSAKPDLW